MWGLAPRSAAPRPRSAGKGAPSSCWSGLLRRTPGVKFPLGDRLGHPADLPKWKSWDRIEQLVQVTVLPARGLPYDRRLVRPSSRCRRRRFRRRLDAGEAPSDLVRR